MEENKPACTLCGEESYTRVILDLEYWPICRYCRTIRGHVRVLREMLRRRQAIAKHLVAIEDIKGRWDQARARNAPNRAYLELTYSIVSPNSGRPDVVDAPLPKLARVAPEPLRERDSERHRKTLEELVGATEEEPRPE